MKNTNRVLKAIVIGFISIGVWGCASSPTPFERFQGFNARAVGKPLTDARVPKSREPFSITRLDNGNVEYRYLLYKASLVKSPCIMIYEVEPNAGIVVKSSYIGDEQSCMIPE